jgi:glutamate-1-semialdehyde 2,1-aminomutase
VEASRVTPTSHGIPSDPRLARLKAEVESEFAARFPRSLALHEKGSAHLIDGVSHTLRASAPFPPWIVSARGGHVTEAGGNDLVDFWQGHYANLLGHNAPEIAGALADHLRLALASTPEAAPPPALQIGMPHPMEEELAFRVARATRTDRVRFTTSGTLATFYALMLARAATGREKILKVAGGWHGSHVWGLKAVALGPRRSAQGGATGDGEDEPTPGVPPGDERDVLVTRFNDPDHLEDLFRKEGGAIAAFVLEPWLGAAGGIPAHPEYLAAARRLTELHGSLLIADEVVTGFRFHAGDVCALYGVRPDLFVFGKALGGGMPLAAVAGGAALLERCGRGRDRRVPFEGGTYSGHPLCLKAALAFLDHVEDPSRRVYERLAALGERAREGVEAAFAAEGVMARCTGRPNAAVRGSSLAMVHFPQDDKVPLDRPETLHDPALMNPVAEESLVKAMLLLEGVHTMHGLGALCTAHTDEDLDRLFAACAAAGRRLRKAGS